MRRRTMTTTISYNEKEEQEEEEEEEDNDYSRVVGGTFHRTSKGYCRERNVSFPQLQFQTNKMQ